MTLRPPWRSSDETVAEPVSRSRTRTAVRAEADLHARLRRAMSRAAVGTAVAVLVLALVLVGFRAAYAGKIYPAISIGGISLGGMPRDEAQARLNAHISQLDSNTVSFTFNGHTFAPKLSDLGISFDSARSVDEAYAYGREDQAVRRLQVTGGLVQGDHTVPLYVSIDENRLNAWFDSVDQQLGLAPHDAYLEIDGTSVKVVPEVEGTIVDRTTSTALIRNAVTTQTPFAATLPTVAWVPHVRAADLTQVKADAEKALSKPISVVYGDQSWSLKPEDLSPFLVQTNDAAKEGAAAVGLTVDESALSQYLSGAFASQIYTKPTNATIGWNGGPVAITASVDGHSLKPQSFADLVTASLLGNHDKVEVPVDDIKPDVDSNNLAALNMTSRLGHGDSNYAGSDWGRATNIGVGAGLLNGTLVAPGGEFSFNHAIGAISPDKGYVPAHVIQAEAIGQDYGGGICQVSTTMFRAALLSGLPITDWTPHSQRISFYEPDGWGPGFDATIYQPANDPMSGTDFKFSNPTDGWLLIEAIADGTHIGINIYGPDTGWTVNISQAQQSDPIAPTGDTEAIDNTLSPGCVVHVQSPLDGLVVWFERQVVDKSGNVVRDGTFETDFQPNGDVWVVSPDMVGQSPAGGGTNAGNCDFSAFNT